MRYRFDFPGARVKAHAYDAASLSAILALRRV
jgi:hypothetical protein